MVERIHLDIFRRQPRDKFFALELLQREVVTSVDILLVPFEIGYHARFELELYVGNEFRSKLSVIFILEVEPRLVRRRYHEPAEYKRHQSDKRGGHKIRHK